MDITCKYYNISICLLKFVWDKFDLKVTKDLYFHLGYVPVILSQLYFLEWQIEFVRQDLEIFFQGNHFAVWRRHVDVFIPHYKNLDFAGVKQFSGNPVKFFFSGAHIGILNSFEGIKRFFAQMVAAIDVHQLRFGIHIKNKAIYTKYGLAKIIALSVAICNGFCSSANI